ncbi:MAG: hypothetical protein EXR95_05185 [Gemmatimonadetes bacterium]|nr:hypothetical protein [Gemmatimonadota bacterium]
MSPKKQSGDADPRADTKKPSGRKPRKSGGDAVDVTWDQPQPRYPAPERPKDRAEERKRVSGATSSGTSRAR